MDKKVRDACRHLEELVNQIDPAKQHDTFAWLHEFLTGLKLLVEKKDPEVAALKRRREIRELQERAKELLDRMGGGHGPLDEPAAALVPSKLKPSPKGSSGGVALPLP